MIEIKFFIKEFPSDLSKSYSLDAYTEGDLSIHVNGEIAFDEEGILLVELSEKLDSWIVRLDVESDLVSDFYYASMDFEEEPILAFNYNVDEQIFRIESVWSKGKTAVKKGELVNACKIFINQLNGAVQEKIKEHQKR